MKKFGFVLIAMAITLVSCNKEMNYKVEAAEYSHGWQAFMNVTMDGDDLSMVDFDYRDEDGNLKSETTTETYPMDPHPTVWLPQVEDQLMSAGVNNYDGIDGITGATHSSHDADAMWEIIIDAIAAEDTELQIYDNSTEE